MKKCTKCGVEYPATDEYFYNRKDGKDGLDSRCKTCYKARKKAWKDSTYEQRKECKDRWRKKEENAIKIKQQAKEWIERNKDRHKEYRDGWRKENKEKISKQAVEWREKNPYKVKWMHLKYRRDINTPDYKEVVNFFEARKNQNGNYNCEYCGCELSLKEATYDHKIPLSRGGDNRIENLAVSCPICNLKKANKILPQFEYLLDSMNVKKEKLAG